MGASRSGSIILAAACLLAAPIAASAGTPSPNLDTTFGAGMVRHDLFERERIDSLAVDPDGRVVAAILETNSPEDRRLIVARFTTAGALDPAFGPNGDGTIEIPASPGGDFNSSTAIGIQGDGKVVVAGRVSYGLDPATLLVARLGTDGTLDDTTDADPGVAFSSDGVVENQFANAFVGDLAIQDNGRIVVVSSVFETFVDDVPTVGILRLTAAGALDPSFDGDGGTGNGRVKVSFGDGTSEGASVAIAPTGEIVVAGHFRPTGDTTAIRFAVARLRSNGTLDTSFNATGMRLRFVGEDDAFAKAVEVLPDGRIVTGGDALQAGDSVMAFAQFRANGTVDPTFGTSGVVLVDVLPGFDSFSGMARTAAGRIVATGTGEMGSFGGSVTALRLTADGVLDPSFDLDGKVGVAFGLKGTSVSAMGLGVGERIVVGGSAPVTEDASDNAIVRLLADGAVDQAFGPAGTAMVPLHRYERSRDSARGVATAPGGKIVAAGTADLEDGWQFGVVRLMPAGGPDLTFGNGGRQTIDFGTGDHRANDVAVTPSGQVIAVGCRSCDTAAPDFAVAKLRADGTPDPDFDLDGQVVTGFGTGLSEVANAVALQANGRIVVAGTVDGDFGVVRYLANGTRDSSFSGDGRVRTDLRSGSVDAAHGVFVQVDGRVNVVGSRRTGDATRFAIVRYLPNGQLDTAFSGDGIVITRVGADESGAIDVTMDSQGRLVVVGDAFIGTNVSPRVAIARYLPNGAPDDTFSGDGQRTDTYGFEAALGRGVAVQLNDRIVVGGLTVDFTGGIFRQMFIARYTTTGAADASFGTDGYDSAFPPGLDADAQGMDLVRDADGRFVLVGDVEYVDEYGVNSAFAFARFDP